MRFAFCLSALILAGCSCSNNVLLGRVEARVGNHRVIVTDCYRTSVPAPQKTDNGWRFTPCRDAEVVIRGEELTVNGQSYGRIKSDDTILVDHSVVSTRPAD